MSSNLKVNTILPSTGTNIGIGTAGGTVTIVGDVDIADKIVHTGDTNTSIRFPSTDTITFETAGAERLRIDSLGRLGLGTNDPSSFNSYARNLVIAQSSGDAGITISAQDAGSEYGSLHFSGGTTVRAYIDQQNGTTGRMFLMNKANGYMGFGTNNTERLRIASDGVITAQKSTTFGNTSDSFTSVTILSSTSGISELRLGDTTANAGYVKYEHTNNALIFATNATERLRVDSSGRVLINTTTTYSSNQMLYVKGGSPSTVYDGQVYLEGSETSGAINTGGTLIFGGHDGGTARTWGAIRTLKENGTSTNYASYMAFLTRPNGSAPTEKLRILSTGELGVNTTAPVEKLGISGNMRFVNPNGTTSRITALPSGSYNTGTSGGSAICFQRFADGGGGSDEIFFETHWQGNRHGESMRINKYGHVTTPNQPSFNVTSSGGQLNSNVGTIVFGDTSSVKNHNTGNHYSTSTGRFTAPVAGRYQINARMLTNSSTTSYTIYLLRVNGSHAGYIGHNHSDFWFMESGGWVLNLSANDYVDCYLQQHSGHLGHNYASFSGFLIG